jgi:hypothetical protein
MPNRSRRILYRAGFLTFCLFPTLALAGWIVNDRVNHGPVTPIADADARPLAEAELSRLLGLAVTLDRITYPPTGYTIVDNVTIADPETGGRIASIPVLEMARGEMGLVITATRPEIDFVRLSTLWETLHTRVLRERGERIVPIDLTAQQATLVSERPGGAPTLTELHARLEPGKATIEFRLAGVDSPNPAKFQATRDRSASPPVTRWELHTGGADVPCVLLADHVPWLAHLGDAAVFNGSLWYEEDEGGWRGEASGRFKRVDLQRLVSDRFPQLLSGEANVTLNRAEFIAGRLRLASGVVEAGPGTIGRNLLGAAFEHLGLQYSPQLPAAVTSDAARYAQLKLGFTIDDAGLQINGACDSEGTVLSLESEPQARVLDQPRQLLPVVSLVRVLAPASELQVPASREADALLRVFPLAALKPPPPQPSISPQGRVRLSE